MASTLCFVVLTCLTGVFARNIDTRNYYDVTYNNQRLIVDETYPVDYKIVSYLDEVRDELDSFEDHQQGRSTIQYSQPLEEKREKVKKTGETRLCVGSVTMMALCY
ncbi:hypothetical protein JTB14_028232 [Gonioctena quinquepunctata]|nr:hypothetical protein JTB14_028232 [Gonioctena quinquepunctata]